MTAVQNDLWSVPDQGPGGDSGVAGGTSPTATQPEAIGGSNAYDAAGRSTLPPFQRHSETSREAAISVYGEVRNTQQSRLYDYLLNHGPATDETCAAMLDMNPSAERPRRIELVEKGLVEACGTGITKSGRKAQLWRAVA